MVDDFYLKVINHFFLFSKVFYYIFELHFINFRFEKAVQVYVYNSFLKPNQNSNIFGKHYALKSEQETLM
jgi:hypothetical protein